MIVLTILERLLISSILPEQGSMLTLKLSMDLKDKIAFGAEEQETLNLRDEFDDEDKMTGQVLWDGENDREFELHSKEIGLVSDILGKLDAEEKLTVHHMSLWDKFREE